MKTFIKIISVVGKVLLVVGAALAFVALMQAPAPGTRRKVRV